MEDGKLSLCQSSNTNESLTDTVIKTLLDSSGAVQTQPTAKHICVFTWVSLRTWPGGCHCGDKWLRTGNALVEVKTEASGKEQSDDEEQTQMALGAYHFAELLRQLFDDHAESLELLKHAGDVLAREAADSLQI